MEQHHPKGVNHPDTGRGLAKRDPVGQARGHRRQGSRARYGGGHLLTATITLLLPSTSAKPSSTPPRPSSAGHRGRRRQAQRPLSEGPAEYTKPPPRRPLTVRESFRFENAGKWRRSRILVSLIARESAPARRARPIVRPPLFRPEWAGRRRPIDGRWISQTGSHVARRGRPFEASHPQRMINEASRTSDRSTVHML